MESEASDTLTLHQRGEDGRYDKRLSSLKVTSRKDLFFPPHIYGQLTKHSEGFNVLLEHGSIEKYIQVSKKIVITCNFQKYCFLIF